MLVIAAPYPRNSSPQGNKRELSVNEIQVAGILTEVTQRGRVSNNNQFMRKIESVAQFVMGKPLLHADLEDSLTLGERIS